MKQTQKAIMLLGGGEEFFWQPSAYFFADEAEAALQVASVVCEIYSVSSCCWRMCEEAEN